jgi:hypothetical protein
MTAGFWWREDFRRRFAVDRFPFVLACQKRWQSHRTLKYFAPPLNLCGRRIEHGAGCSLRVFGARTDAPRKQKKAREISPGLFPSTLR